MATNPEKWGQRLYTGGSHYGGMTLGSDVVHTSNYNHELPTTLNVSAGWGKVGSGECIEGLGVLYARGGKISKQTPLSAYYTPAGQLAGVKLTIWGSSDELPRGQTLMYSVFSKTNVSAVQKGNPAVGNLEKAGYFIPVPATSYMWEISVSFRPAEDVCSTTTLRHETGDR